MDLKELLMKYGLGILIMIIIGGVIYIYSDGELVPISGHSACDNSGRFDGKMDRDSCEAIDSTEAQADFSRYIRTSGVSEPFGAWIGKDLIDTLFSGNDSNGVFIMIGKDAAGRNCFLLTVGKTNYRTLAIPNPDTKTYFRLEAMCPALCDGLDPRK